MSPSEEEDQRKISDNAAGPRIILAGGGRLAQTLLRSIPEMICAILLKEHTKGDRLKNIFPGLAVITSLADIPPDVYNTLWLLTSDDALAAVAASLAPQRASWEGITVLHSSGATPVSVLVPFVERGAIILALHPNGSFTGDGAIPSGLVWGISGDERGAQAASRLIGRFAPKLVPVADEHRALYHAAASVASNYSVTLFAIAEELYRRAGFSEPDARQVVAAFIGSSAARAATLGAQQALTGPIMRGDNDVVARQMDALRKFAPEYFECLAELALQTARLAGNGIIGNEIIGEWRRTIEGREGSGE